MTLAAILRNATFTDRPETRSGEELYWHALAGQYVALPSVSASADEQLRKHGYQPVRPDQAKSAQFDALAALRRLWPDLHKPHTDLIAHRLTGETCRALISLQPAEDRGRMGRWLMARCKALGKNDVATAVGEYMATADVRAAHPWATGRGQSNQFLLSQSLGSAFILTGGEASGYTLHTFVTGDSAPRQRNGETIRDILTPNAEWSNTDWEHYDALLTAKPASESEFWDHPALLKFLGVRNKIIESGSDSWAARVRSNGAGALLGERHAALQKRFLNAISAAWLDHMADDLGLQLNNQIAYRLLTDCWMALRTSDAECISHIVPAIREAHSDAFADHTDNQLLSLWRSSFQPITDHIRQASTGKKNAELIRTSQAYADMSPATMRDVLSAHYGAPAIDALVNAGKLHLLANHQSLPMDIRLRSSSNLSNIAGATTPDNTVYLIGNRITPQTLPGLFLHEVGEHAALANMLGPDYGRMSKHFQKLLRDKDTYATWAAMRVPSSTRPEHVASEQLAYLVERVANDENARPGGQGGYALGQECLANLRTWLFRTPLCRWLDEIGALDDFTLRPQDMASLAREAVDFFVDQVEPGTVTKNQNTWIDALNPATLDTLYRSAPQARIQELEKLGAEQALGYLYALAMTRAPLIGTAIDHFSATLATLASGTEKPELQAVAGELLVLQQSMDTQAQLKAQVDRAGFAMWIDGTSDPEDARLHFLAPSPKNPGMWQLNHYRKGIGAYRDDQYDSVEVALDQAQPASFMVSEAEAATVLQDWAAITDQNQQTRSQSFNRWFGASQAADSAGNARVLYHGTGKDFTEFKGLTIWASTSPALANEYADYRGAWEEGSASIMPVYMQAERPFDADKLETTVTLKSFFEEAAAQANASGRTFDAEQAVVLLNHIKGCSRREESGPYYRAHDIWSGAQSMFGSDGAESVKALMKLLGFDSIKMTEQDQVTFGVFEPGQVKSAIGNRGSFNANNADIRFKGSNLADTSVFKAWFTDSKILTDVGEPMVVYHGTDAAFADFQGDQIFFADSEYAARQYGKNVMPVYLNITNPKVIDYYGQGDNTIEDDIEDAREEGYDGLIARRAFDGRLVFDQYVAFDKGQIQSAMSTEADMQPPVVEAEPVDSVAALKRWAGNTKVVNEHGLPKVVFHGTGADILRFDPAMIGEGADWDKSGTDAFWFSSSETVSTMFAELTDSPAIMPVFLKLENPLVVDSEQWARRFDTLDEGFKFGEGRISYNIKWFKREAIAQARTEGRDGVIFLKGYDGPPVEDAINYAVFEPAQIKSAIGNRGTYDRASDDIRLKVITPTETPAFTRWFDDSKVVGTDGKPLVVYHGTKADFSEFDPAKIGASDEGLAGKGFYFTYNPEEASSYAMRDNFGSGDAPNVLPAYVSLRNPLVITHGVLPDGRKVQDLHGGIGINANGGEAVRKLAEDGNHDGVMWVSLDGAVRHVMAFHSEQIKSAIGNNGDFDPANPDIRFSVKSIAAGSSTKTDALKEWFGDSKVVGAEGEPLVLYRGVVAGNLSDGMLNAEPRPGYAVFASSSPHVAASYANPDTLEGETGALVPIYVKANELVEFPVRIDRWGHRQFSKTGFDEAARRLLPGQVLVARKVHDTGPRARDDIDPKRLYSYGHDLYAFGQGTSVKSAIGNIGTFAPANADIRFKSNEPSDSPAFKAWFDHSKVVDGSGKPLVVYHGTKADISAFDPELAGSSLSAQASGVPGFYFAKNPGTANGFARSTVAGGNNVMPVYLALKNPATVEYAELMSGAFDRKNLEADGYDGVQVRRDDDTWAYIAFHSEQIKSAIGNNGDFDPNNADIRYSVESIASVPLRRFEAARDAFADLLDSNGVHHGLASMTPHQVMDDIDWLLQFMSRDQAALAKAKSLYLPIETAYNQLGRLDRDALSRAAEREVAPPVETLRGDAVEARQDSSGKWFKVNRNGEWGVVPHDSEVEAMRSPAVADIRSLADDAAAAFDGWFGDSKVVGADGEPLVVYHGTAADFTQFEAQRFGQNFKGNPDTGFYFTNNAGDRYSEDTSASGYATHVAGLTGQGGANVMPVYLSIKNPLVIEEDMSSVGGAIAYADTFRRDIRRWIDSSEFDGIIIRDLSSELESLNDGPETVYIAFRPEQIKSAIGNAGTYDPDNADIRFSFAGENAQTANRDLLTQAQERITAGEDAEIVRRETGWFQGHDQGWRFELDDSQAVIPDHWYQDGEANGFPVKRMDGYLGDHFVDLHPVAAASLGKSSAKVTGILNHLELFAAYPQLSTINVVLEQSEGYSFAENGVFRRDTVNGQPYDSILIRYNPARGGNGLSALLHEVQHAIQKVEGFARGGSTSEFNAEQLISQELSSINQRTNQLLEQNPETATVYRACVRLRIQANNAGWPEQMMANVAALEAELVELPGGEELFDLEAERFGIQFIDKIALPFEKYRQLAGEVEARNVQTRLGFDAQMRLDIAPLSTEDVAPDQVDVQPNSGRVLIMAFQQEQAERDSAAESALDMSREARLARAQAMGFDTSKVWYHGSDAAGFKVFDTEGKGKTKGTGAFLANRYDMAGSYSKRNVDAPIFTGEDLFNDPDQLDDLEIERLWVAENSRGIVEFQASQRDYDTAEQFLEGEGIEPDPSDVVRAAYTIHHEGYLLVENATEQEAVDELNKIEAKEPGIYSLYVRSPDQLVIDWESKNWDQGPEVPVWKICDQDDEVMEYCYSKETADEALARHPGCHIAEGSEAPYLTTDDAAGQARDMGYDSVLIKNVYDSGSHSDGSIEGDVLVVFDPANIRSTDAVFDPAHTASGNLLFSITEAPQSPAFDQWFNGSQVCNDDGTPLVVYRGEHARSSDAVFQSRLGSLSFGDYETASLYATQPNNLSDSPISPRIIPAYLAIKCPLVVNDDPFVDFSLLIETLGFERAAVIATDLAGYIHNTQAWADLNSSLPVGDYITKHPEALASLYVELYPILDDPKYVDWLKAAGFDGAIYGGSGASFDKTEYRVFDPAQVANGAPMPVTPNAPSSSTRMALTQPAPSTPRFIGSPVSGEQFTLEYYGIGIPGQYGYGLYLPDAKAVGERAGNNGAINKYAGAALTPATIRKLRTDEATPVALRRLFASFAKELADGDDAQALLQAHIRTLQNSLAGIELDQSDLERGESVLLSAAYYAELERQVKAELGTLINHMPKFEHVRPSSSLPSPADYLSWDAPLADQPDEIRDALAMIGVDGYWEVQSEQGAVGFMSKIEADAHYARLSNEGGNPSLVDQFEPGHPDVPSGGDIYRELSKLLGSAQEASARLRGAGIKGIRYLPAPSPTGDAPERYVIFSSPQPRKLPAVLPDLAEQKGIDQPVYPMAFSKLPAVVLNGQIDVIAHDLQEARTLMATTLERKIDDLEDRHHWLSNLPNADGQLFQLNKAALFQARNELQQLNRWRSPDVGNCLSWSSPLSDEACNRLAPLIRVSPAEQINGEVVFHLLAERIGSNKAATDALMKTGFVGAYTEQGVAMWDAASRCLSQKISASHDRNRYHLVAHGSKHLIDSFSSEKIGTGEGVQAFGYGLYFADRKMVAAHYQKMRVREGCWYERTLYDTPSEMVQEVAQRLARAAVSEDMLQAAKHCLSIATWAPQRVDDVIQQYPSEHHQPIREILNGYSKVSSDQLTSFFLMPQKGVRGLNEIMEHDDRDYSMGLSYLGSGLHFYVREDMDDLKISQTLTDHIRRQCDVEQAIEARNQVLLDLERKPHDDYFQSRLRDCDYFLNMAKCAQKTLDAYGPFSLERPLGNGNLYLVDLAINPSEYLRYDLPFSQQSTCVQQALHAITTEPALSESKQQALIKAIAENQMGHDLLGSIAGRGNFYDAACSENEILASSLLLARDVQGVKYPDGLSREVGGGSFNYVVFNDERIQILGHSDKHLRSESDEIPLYEWADTELLDKAQRLSI